MASKDELFAEVRARLAEALNVEEKEIEPTTTLSDLGVEPIDVLDIVFRMDLVEKKWVQRCPKCGNGDLLELCDPAGVALCARCGFLLPREFGTKP